MTPNDYMAQQLMSVKSQNAFMTFLTTFWSGKYVMVTWDNLNHKVMQLWGTDDLTDEQLAGLYELVYNFMGEYKEKT